MQINSNFKNFKFFYGKRDAFNFARIRARVFRSLVDCSNQLSYTGFRHLLPLRKTPLYRLTALPYDCNDFKLGGLVQNYCHCLHYRMIINRVSARIRRRQVSLQTISKSYMVRAVDRPSKDTRSNPGTAKCVSSSTEGIQILQI